jgi:hypothetical protein
MGECLTTIALKAFILQISSFILCL